MPDCKVLKTKTSAIHLAYVSVLLRAVTIAVGEADTVRSLSIVSRCFNSGSGCSNRVLRSIETRWSSLSTVTIKKLNLDLIGKSATISGILGQQNRP